MSNFENNPSVFFCVFTYHFTYHGIYGILTELNHASIYIPSDVFYCTEARVFKRQLSTRE